MFVYLLLLAIFSFALFVEADPLRQTPQCNETLINNIYTYSYWKNNGGVPQHITENNIACYPREVAILSNPQLYDEDVTCAAIDHFDGSDIVYVMKGSNVSYTSKIVNEEDNGQLFEPQTKKFRFEIAEAGCARLLYQCSRNSDAEEGAALFDIKGVEGKATEEGIKAMKDLLFNTFDSHQTLRTFSEPCPLPTEKPRQPEEHCANKC